MKFTITKTSDWKYKSSKEITSLEDLMTFVNNNGGTIVLITEENTAEIEIYDTWRE